MPPAFPHQTRRRTARTPALVIGFLCAAAGLAPPARAQLLHQYTFTAGANDDVGSANGTLVGGAVAAGGMLTLDGSTGYVQFGQHLVPTSGSYSISLFATQRTPQEGFFEFLSQGFSGGPGFYIGGTGGPGSPLRATDSWQNTGVGLPAVGARNNYVLTVDAVNDVSRFYLDGTLAATLNMAITTTTGGTDTRFGRQFDPYSEFFAGSLQDVRIYGNALSASDVAAIYEAGPSGGSVVPEPTSVALTGAGLAVLGVTVRRRTHA